MHDGAHQLEYAASPPWYRRRRVRGALMLIGLVVVLTAGWPVGQRYVHRLVRAYYHRQCLNYTAPTDQIVYDEAAGTSIVPACWKNLYSTVSRPGFQSGGTVFLHRRRADDGKDYLLVVDFLKTKSVGGYRGVDFSVRVFSGPEPWEIVTMFQSGVAGGEDLIFPADAKLRLFAGQPDPHDPSHFTMHYEVNGRSGIIDGYLLRPRYVVLEHRQKTTQPHEPSGE